MKPVLCGQIFLQEEMLFCPQLALQQLFQKNLSSLWLRHHFLMFSKLTFNMVSNC